ncbi:MAG: hypothetical protein INQ03_09500 [Candidatus Heimdallarchaeota archaeon]|nr:hypothetical protein [Candidatus Heimdallarchaeota archaeon]
MSTIKYEVILWSMMNQDQFVDEITKALVKRISTEDHVAIMLMYGSRAKKTHTPKSDVEYIVVRDGGKKINFEFIYKDIPADLWSITWEELEKISRRETYFILPAGAYMKGKVLYSRSEADVKRFDLIQSSIIDFEKFKDIHYSKAMEHFQNLKMHMADMLIAKNYTDLGHARTAANNLLIGAAYVLGHLNLKYYTENWGANLHESLKFEYLPQNYKYNIELLSSAGDFETLIQTGTDLIDSMRLLLIERFEGIPDPQEITGETDLTYLSYNNKIRKSAGKKDILSLSYAVHDMQFPLMHEEAMKRGKWSKSSVLKLYSEFIDDYCQAGYSDFTTAVINKEFQKILELVEKQEHIFLPPQSHILNSIIDLDEFLHSH